MHNVPMLSNYINDHHEPTCELLLNAHTCNDIILHFKAL